MNTLTQINVKLNNLKSSTSRSHTRKPVLETLEERALLSSSYAALQSGFADQVAVRQSPALSDRADPSPGGGTALRNDALRNTSLAMGANGEPVRVCLRHAVACTSVANRADRPLGLSSLASSEGPRFAALTLTVGADDDDPPPDPEPAPPVDPINGPIQYPPLPPSGPSGPG
jgi:hypothetical protein